MTWTTRNVALAAVAGVLAVLFSALGVWQLQRHDEASARAEFQRRRLLSPPLRIDSGPLPPVDSLLWRRVELSGRLEHQATVVLRGRGLQGTPGVHVVAPLVRAAGPDVLVDRGWMPAADGIHADLSRGIPRQAPAVVTVRGVALPGADEAGDVRFTEVRGERRFVAARLAPSVLADSLGRELAAFYVREVTDRSFDDPSAPRRVGWGGRPPSAGDDSLPVALALPEPDAGPHMSYAIQWFAFALIAVGGTGAYLLTRGREA